MAAGPSEGTMSANPSAPPAIKTPADCASGGIAKPAEQPHLTAAQYRVRLWKTNEKSIIFIETHHKNTYDFHILAAPPARKTPRAEALRSRPSSRAAAPARDAAKSCPELGRNADGDMTFGLGGSSRIDAASHSQFSS